MMKEAFKLKMEAFQITECSPDSLGRYQRARSAVAKAVVEVKALAWMSLDRTQTRCGLRREG